MLTGFLTSQASASVFIPNRFNSSAAFSHRSFLRAQRTRFAPISARPSAICRPSPTPPPVTIATRPVRSKSCLTLVLAASISSVWLDREISLESGIAIVAIDFVPFTREGRWNLRRQPKKRLLRGGSEDSGGVPLAPPHPSKLEQEAYTQLDLALRKRRSEGQRRAGRDGGSIR